MKREKRGTHDFACLSRSSTPRNRSGQLDISFGMIFSIILIIIFLAFGFYAIKKFLDLQETVQIGKFSQDLQKNVDDMWKSSGRQNVFYTLPTKITFVCFVSGESRNMKFTSSQIIEGKEIQNIDIANITSIENPYCIPNVKGKVSMTISKNQGESLVTIQRQNV
jgi:hypothetical protein